MDYLQYEDIKNNIKDRIAVLNLIINGLPSISIIKELPNLPQEVLNLIINGLPSIFGFSNISLLSEFK